MSPNAPHRDFACASAAFFRDDSAEKPTIREFPGIATLVRPCLSQEGDESERPVKNIGQARAA